MSSSALRSFSISSSKLQPAIIMIDPNEEVRRELQRLFRKHVVKGTSRRRSRDRRDACNCKLDGLKQLCGRPQTDKRKPCPVGSRLQLSSASPKHGVHLGDFVSVLHHGREYHLAYLVGLTRHEEQPQYKLVCVSLRKLSMTHCRPRISSSRAES